MSVERNSRVNVFLDVNQLQVASDAASERVLKLTNKLEKLQLAGKSNTPEFVKLADALESAKNKADQTAGMLSGKYTLSIKQAEAETKKLERAIAALPGNHADREKMIAELAQMNTKLAEMKNEAGLVGNSLKKAANESTSAWGKWKDIAIGTVIGNTVSSALQTIGAWIGGIGKLRNEFEATLGNLSAITGATGNDLDYLRNQALRLGMQGKTSATEWLEAFKLVGSAKPELLQNGAALVEVTRAAKLLSAASGMELKSAVESLTDTLNQYGAEANKAKEFTDALAAGAKYGAAEVNDESAAIKEFGTQAKSANISIYESVGAVQLLAEKGIKGSDAGTKLRNVMLALSAVKGLDKKALDSLADYGVNTDILQDKTKSLEVRLTEIGKIANDNAALVKVFGKENFNAAQIVLQNIPRYAQLTDQVKEQGVATAQASANTQNFGMAAGRLGNVLETLLVSMRTPQVFTDWANGLSDLLTQFGKFTGLIDESTDALDAFKKQQEKVNGLEKTMNPLLARYDELKSKTKLGKDEQVELNKVINSIASAIPGAVTEWDKYGNAIAISSSKAKEFIELQKLILKVKNEEAIKDTEKQIWAQNDAQKEYNRQLLQTEAQFKKYQDQVAYFQKNYSAEERLKMLRNPDSADGASTGSFSQAQARLERYTEQLDKLKTAAAEGRDKLAGLKGIVNELSGNSLTTPSPTTSSTTTTPNIISGGGDDAKKELESYEKFRDDLALLTADSDEKAIVKLQQHYSEMLEKAEIAHKKGLISDEQYIKDYDALMGAWNRDKDAEEFKQLEKVVDDLEKQQDAEDKATAKKLAAQKKADEDQLKESDKFLADWIKEQKDAADKELAIEKEKEHLKQKIADQSKKAVVAGAQLLQTMYARDLELFQRKNNAELRILEKRHQDGHISDKEYKEKKDALLKDSEKKSAESAVKQAKLSKAMALTEIGVDTAKGVMQINANAAVNADITQTLRAILTGLIITTGAAQAAAVIAQPLPEIPAYELGTDASKPGLKLVGEKGPELIYTPGNDKIWTASRTAELLQPKTISTSMPQMNFGAASASISNSRGNVSDGNSFFSGGRADAFFDGQNAMHGTLQSLLAEWRKGIDARVSLQQYRATDDKLTKYQERAGINR